MSHADTLGVPPHKDAAYVDMINKEPYYDPFLAGDALEFKEPYHEFLPKKGRKKKKLKVFFAGKKVRRKKTRK